MTGAASSLAIVTWSWPGAIVAFCGADSLSAKVSGLSGVVSPTTATGTVLAVSPGANVSVPVAGVKSEPAAALPGTVA